jgi:hypothetical protein
MLTASSPLDWSGVTKRVWNAERVTGFSGVKLLGFTNDSYMAFLKKKKEFVSCEYKCCTVSTSATSWY